MVSCFLLVGCCYFLLVLLFFIVSLWYLVVSCCFSFKVSTSSNSECHIAMFFIFDFTSVLALARYSPTISESFQKRVNGHLSNNITDSGAP